MKTQFSKLAFVATFGLALTLTFGCSSDSDNGNNPPNINSGTEISSSSSLGAYPPSSGGGSHSSSSGGSSSSPSSGGNGHSSSSALKECESTFNPTNKFCYDGNVYDKCDGMPYNPSSQICEDGVANPTKCNGMGYNPLTQRCESNVIQAKCGESWYPWSDYECTSNGIYLKGGLTDTRDGKYYDAVLIGTQTWMAANLSYNATNSKCYGEDGIVIVYDGDGNRNELAPLSSTEIQANCTKYGRLYDWETAVNACPEGWRLPSNEELNVLTDYPSGSYIVGGKLKATSGWNENGNGEDTYGFAALPSGSGYYNSYYDTFNTFSHVGYRGFWWLVGRYYYYIEDNSIYSLYSYSYGGSDLYSIRCVKD